jgi:hypothetical protein
VSIRGITSGHVEHACDGNHGEYQQTCMFCDGGLFACDVCNAFEGATPDQCPGRRMTADESDAVYAGQLNYRDGQWHEECCAVMRPALDTDAWMAEQGWRRDAEGRWQETSA